VLEANSAACSFFEKLLAHPEQGKAAREYLAERRIDSDSIKRFQIGYAPVGWDGLLSSPSVASSRPPMLARAGLAKEKANDRGDVVSHYDTFRNRLMFPIRDENSPRDRLWRTASCRAPDDPAKYLKQPGNPGLFQEPLHLRPGPGPSTHRRNPHRRRRRRLHRRRHGPPVRRPATSSPS
jgi:DNA primase